MLDLGVLSGSPVSYAGRLNNSGQVVGTSGHAVMWTVALTPPTPQEQIEEIAAKVDVLVSAGTLNAGEGNALDSKLDAATAQLNKGSTNAACNVLGAFNNQVEALVLTERLSPAQGQPLIDAANAVSDQLR